MIHYFEGPTSYTVGDVIGNRGVIVIGGESHHIYQNDGKSPQVLVSSRLLSSTRYGAEAESRNHFKVERWKAMN